MAVKTDKKRKSSRDKKGRFTKGNPGKPKGATSHFTIAVLEDAIREVEKEKKKNLFKHFVKRALDDDGVLVALMRKLVPDLKQTTLEPGAGIEDLVRIYLPKKDGRVASAT